MDNIKIIIGGHNFIIAWYKGAKRMSYQCPIKLIPAMNDDVSFYRLAHKIVEQNLSDPDFGVHELYRALNMGRTQLHNLMKIHTGMSASLFIRSVRLKHARILIRTTQLNISEVAYRVGFNDPNYFTRCYKEAFGEPPTQTKHS